MTKVPGRAESYEQKSDVVRRLRDQWVTRVDMRLGQLIVNAIGDRDPFNLEDDELVRLVTEFVKEHA